MATRKTNEFLTALKEKSADLVSLSYWGTKNNNSTSWDETRRGPADFWVESPLRAFSLEGIQRYVDGICLKFPEHNDMSGN